MYQRKIFLDIKDSDIFYRCLGFKFYFTSIKRRDVFIRNLNSYIKNETARIYNKYEVMISDLELYLAFSLYKQIEKNYKIEQLLDNSKVVKRTLYELPKFIIYGVEEDDN